jgi:biotin operon repressor
MSIEIDLNLSPEDLRKKYPNTPKYLLLTDILMRYPDGISHHYVRKFFNINNKSTMHSAFKRVKNRTKDIDVHSHNNLAFIRIGKKKPTDDDRKNVLNEIANYNRPVLNSLSDNKYNLQTESISNNIKKLLIDNPEGVSSENISSILKANMQSIYNAIYYLRSNGYKILQNNSIYYLESAPKILDNEITAIQNEDSNKPKQLQNNSKFNFSNINNSTIDKIRKLPEQDRIDVYDMLKKSLYYQKSATALMEANEVIIQLHNEVEKGILS